MHQEAFPPVRRTPARTARPDGPAAPPPTVPAGQDHTTSTTERGSFCLARCTCGWSGPARRSRDLARTDAERHRTAA
ncbi:hypothetical protein OG233_16835 [Streptomyces sp. NBC_01218]|uniref:hypothetical protein n=1 Tax=unclassified Streptomyces TaxID=2593676 RepID=UPI0023B90E4D|nr:MULTISPECIES: hypothetical protein [unclassified Streptomyces]WEH41033.1 hypothetical protein PZB77_16865 [Streptomyces sp. AM 2-1-1]WSQ52685.1 hypothetical protein OG233_16835 [Streptomyces sp. NBC_01218]